MASVSPESTEIRGALYDLNRRLDQPLDVEASHLASSEVAKVPPLPALSYSIPPRTSDMFKQNFFAFHEMCTWSECMHRYTQFLIFGIWASLCWCFRFCWSECVCVGHIFTKLSYSERNWKNVLTHREAGKMHTIAKTNKSNETFIGMLKVSLLFVLTFPCLNMCIFTVCDSCGYS